MAALVGTIQIRKDTAANWTANNPTLLSGEQGLETDTRRVKIGDGATLWNALSYSLNPLGVAAATDILRRSDGDARYDASGSAAAAQSAAATDATTKANAAQAAAIAASQPLDSDLTAIAALTPSNDDIIQRKAGAWTNRTIAQLYTDLASAGFVARTGSALAFDKNATYNSPTSPGSASVTLDTTGAVAGVEVVGYFNHSVEPTWPAGITAVGTWYNSGLNVVRFVYIDASNISAVISNERPVSEWQIVRKSSATTRTSTATLAADPTLSIPIAANQSVIIRGFITVTSAATPDFKYRLTGPATPSEVRIQCVHGAASGVTAPSNAVRDAYDSADLVFLMTGTQSGTILVNMEVVNGANSGNIAFEWAQNTSDAGNTTVRTNSYLEYQYA